MQACENSERRRFRTDWTYVQPESAAAPGYRKIKYTNAATSKTQYIIISFEGQRGAR